MSAVIGQLADIMFQPNTKKTHIGGAGAMLVLIFHATVRSIRKTHRSPLVGLLMNIMQAVIMVGIFYLMFSVLGLRGNAIRGDFLVYIMSGIFLFMTHIKAVSAVQGAEGPASPMMQHAPMNTIVAICAAALGALYIQILSVATMMFVYHTLINEFTIEKPIPLMGMLLLSWFSGCCVGLVFLALKPWMPAVVNIMSNIYQRANMIASGKMFVANTLPGWMLAMFDWNPLFHCIDQARGFAFINYNPHYSSVSYPVYVSLVLLIIGLMGEFYTRKHVSRSWSATR